MRHILSTTSLLTLSALFLSFPLPVSATDAVTAPAPAAEAPATTAAPAKEDPPVVAGPALRDLEKYTVELLRGLSQPEAQYLYGIRARHGVIRSVTVVKEDIGNAVRACGKNNPSLAEPMKTRFAEWTAGITPLIEEAKRDIGLAIGQQTFRPVARVNELIAKVDAAFEERDAQVSKVPVTTAEACQGLLDNLNETEKSLNQLLRQTITELKDPPPTPSENPPVSSGGVTPERAPEIPPAEPTPRPE